MPAQGHASATATFGTVTSSLQTASDAAVHGSPPPSPLSSLPPAVIARQTLPKEEKLLARSTKNAVSSVWNGAGSGRTETANERWRASNSGVNSVTSGTGKGTGVKERQDPLASSPKE